MTKSSDKERILKAAKENIYIQGQPLRLSANFSVETFQARREWLDTYKVHRGKPATQKTTQQGYHSEQKDREFPRQTEVREIHHR